MPMTDGMGDPRGLVNKKVFCSERPDCCSLHKNAWLLYLAAREAENTLNTLADPANPLCQINSFSALGRLRWAFEAIEKGGKADDKAQTVPG